MNGHSKDELLRTAIACLLKFLQQNFSGPRTTDTADNAAGVSAKLAMNGEDVDVNVVGAEHLLCSKVILEHLYSQYSDDLVSVAINARISVLSATHSSFRSLTYGTVGTQ
jgi:hypothetical protein